MMPCGVIESISDYGSGGTGLSPVMATIVLLLKGVGRQGSSAFTLHGGLSLYGKTSRCDREEQSSILESTLVALRIARGVMAA